MQKGAGTCSVPLFMPVAIPKPSADLALKAAFLTALAVVTWLSLAPGALQPPSGISDKFKHTTAYCLLGILGLLAFRNHPLRVTGFLFGWGILMEAGQGLVPRRTPEFADGLANLFGILLALGVARLLRGRIPVPTS